VFGERLGYLQSSLVSLQRSSKSLSIALAHCSSCPFRFKSRFNLHCSRMSSRALDRKPVVAKLEAMNARFSDDEKALLEQAFQLRESQTEEQRATMRAELEANWPALVAYIKDAEAHGKKMKGDVLFTLCESQGGPSIEKIVWYLLDRAVMHTKRAA
jgi:hypothetical protein